MKHNIAFTLPEEPTPFEDCYDKYYLLIIQSLINDAYLTKTEKLLNELLIESKKHKQDLEHTNRLVAMGLLIHLQNNWQQLTFAQIIRFAKFSADHLHYSDKAFYLADIGTFFLTIANKYNDGATPRAFYRLAKPYFKKFDESHNENESIVKSIFYYLSYAQVMTGLKEDQEAILLYQKAFKKAVKYVEMKQKTVQYIKSSSLDRVIPKATMDLLHSIASLNDASKINYGDPKNEKALIESYIPYREALTELFSSGIILDKDINGYLYTYIKSLIQANKAQTARTILEHLIKAGFAQKTIGVEVLDTLLLLGDSFIPLKAYSDLSDHYTRLLSLPSIVASKELQIKVYQSCISTYSKLENFPKVKNYIIEAFNTFAIDKDTKNSQIILDYLYTIYMGCIDPNIDLINLFTTKLVPQVKNAIKNKYILNNSLESLLTIACDLNKEQKGKSKKNQKNQLKIITSLKSMLQIEDTKENRSFLAFAAMVYMQACNKYNFPQEIISFYHAKALSNFLKDLLAYSIAKNEIYTALNFPNIKEADINQLIQSYKDYINNGCIHLNPMHIDLRNILTSRLLAEKLYEDAFILLVNCIKDSNNFTFTDVQQFLDIEINSTSNTNNFYYAIDNVESKFSQLPYSDIATELFICIYDDIDNIKTVLGYLDNFEKYFKALSPSKENILWLEYSLNFLLQKFAATNIDLLKHSMPKIRELVASLIASNIISNEDETIIQEKIYSLAPNDPLPIVNVAQSSPENNSTELPPNNDTSGTDESNTNESGQEKLSSTEVSIDIVTSSDSEQIDNIENELPKQDEEVTLEQEVYTDPKQYHHDKQIEKKQLEHSIRLQEPLPQVTIYTWSTSLNSNMKLVFAFYESTEQFNKNQPPSIFATINIVLLKELPKSMQCKLLTALQNNIILPEHAKGENGVKALKNSANKIKVLELVITAYDGRFHATAKDVSYSSEKMPIASLNRDGNHTDVRNAVKKSKGEIVLYRAK